MKTYKTADGIDIKVGMEIWVNPACVFEGPIFRTSFVKKQIVSEIDKTLKGQPIIAHNEGEEHLSCVFSPDIIFFNKEKWADDRKKRYIEVLIEKRKELGDYIEEKLKEIHKIEVNMDNVDNWISF